MPDLKLNKIQHQAEILSNRVLKRYKHLKKRFARQNIDCFRLYDWDIPEVRAVVDWYAGHLVIAEYVRKQSDPQWLPEMAKAVGAALNIPTDKIFIKKRETGTARDASYNKMDSINTRLEVNERNLKLWVNLSDYLDTGLFSDHRETRLLIQEMSKGHDFLNLYGYTGAFTCAAALGGAKSTVTVDRSATYLNWTKENMELNNLWGKQHQIVPSDVDDFLNDAIKEERRFTLGFVDPPSFFQDKKRKISFDVNKDHRSLLLKVFKTLAPGSTVFFSTNHQRFVPKLDKLPVKDLHEITPPTIPDDYRNKYIHRCWKMITF